MNTRPAFSAGQLRRFFVIICLVALAGIVLLVKFAHIMLAPQYGAGAQGGGAAGDRGRILDRNGRTLAIQTRFGHISVWKPDLPDEGRDVVFHRLGELLQLEPEEIARRVDSAPGNFLYLQKHVDAATTQEIESEILAGALRGVTVETIFGRVYPEQSLAGSIIGIVGDENKGLEGIEYTFDKELSPRFSGGQARNGDTVVLTIDANVQYILEDIAGRTQAENEAEAVMLMAMDPRSGEILGSASMPGFNPNLFRESTREQRIHRPVELTYEPGSVFKIFSLSLLMDSGAALPGTVFVCDGRYEHITNLGERVIINCLGAHGRVNIRDIIIYSCNAGSAYASDREAILPFYNGIRSLGFGAKTGAELPGEASGFMRPAERWSDRSKPTIAIGQEIAVSAMQMLEAATAVANDGVLVRPHFVRELRPADGTAPRQHAAEEPRRVLKAETTRLMRSYMQAVTSDIGTGWRANVADLNLAVKTGTAQVIDPVTGRYSDTEFIASCMALLPAEAPTLVLYLAIVKPKGINYLGGRIAAPPIREAAEELVNYLGIPRGKNPQVRHSGEIIVPNQAPPELGAYMPDLTGFSKRALLPLLLNDTVQFDLRGDGWVRRQYPPPGSPLRPGDTIILELE
jgi:cell division protein FtsI (penicillin-binding protein 3)